jgi:hypothetical protein
VNHNLEIVLQVVEDCFMMTNKSEKAIKLASTGVAGVFKSLETLKEGL